MYSCVSHVETVDILALFVALLKFQQARLILSLSVADLGGRPRRAPPPPSDQIFLDFMQFLGKFNKIVSQRPPPWGLAPPLGKSWIRH